jgi:hypothetical protein
MQIQTETPICTPEAGTQQPHMAGSDDKKPAAPFGLRATWLHFANELEIRRLAKLHMRIERKRASLAELVGQRQTIMRRCIRRMRRAGGKN